MEENQGGIPNMKVGRAVSVNYKEKRAVCDYKKQGNNGDLSLKIFHSPYHLPQPNITSPKDLTDLEGWNYLH